MSRETNGSATVLFVHVTGGQQVLQDAIRTAMASIQRSPGTIVTVQGPARTLGTGAPRQTVAVSDDPSPPQTDMFDVPPTEPIEAAKPRRGKREAPQMVDGLDMNAGSTPFAEWVKGFDYDSGPDRALLAAAYLRDHRNINEINLHHLYSSYRFADWNNPKSFHDLLNDTRRKARYLSTGSKAGWYKVSPLGENRLREMKTGNAEG